MREIDLSAEDLVKALLSLDSEARLCLLDSSSAVHGNSHQLIAGIYPIDVCRFEGRDADETLNFLEQKLKDHPNAAGIFTIAYDFGLKLEDIKTRHHGITGFPEPDIFITFFESLILHDYASGKTYLTGNIDNYEKIDAELRSALVNSASKTKLSFGTSIVHSNFSKTEYLAAIERARQFIHRGDTYQINMTQQLRAELPPMLTSENIFLDLRENYPAPFSAFVRRGENTVVSISPERFLRIEKIDGKKIIHAAPIKGTRSRGETPSEDEKLKTELLSSEKDRAENVMIVDLLRNDIGRVCKAGSVRVEELCALEEHPTLFHLVSTIRGELNEDVSFAELIKAVFPCGSITGAPKIRTMQLIDELETASRGLSMGAIGYIDFDGTIDMSVAIRTMVVRGNKAVFNVGGGIVADSIPEAEYEETLVKARALLNAINGKLSFE
jgi:para-aminobenzoate synthetase component 1